MVQLGQRGGDAQLLAGGAEVEAGTPVEPVGAGAKALPAAVAIELAQVAEQLVGGGLDAGGELGDLVAEQVEVGRRHRVGRRGFLGTGGHRGDALVRRHPSRGKRPRRLLEYGWLRPLRRGCARWQRHRVVIHHAHGTPGFRPPSEGPWRDRSPYSQAERTALCADMRTISAGSGTGRYQAPQTVLTPEVRNRGFFRLFLADQGGGSGGSELATAVPCGRRASGSSRRHPAASPAGAVWNPWQAGNSMHAAKEQVTRWSRPAYHFRNRQR